ncbi:MAG: NTP transferase domain-containing protein [Candidatus Zixiibacteriota bacterium]|jgi:spore coat polysaccharide biosynthesis protein SpsF (cytidylyltransferase family)
MDETVVLIQARMGSTRLPGKVLLPLGGAPVLAHVVERCGTAPGVGAVVVATTDEPEDDALAACAADLGAGVFRGSSADVLGRFAGAAAAFPAAHYIRITADCPLADPAVVGAVLAAHMDGGRDYSYNDVPVGFPRGYDVEVVRGATLLWLAENCRDAASREHVTPYLRDHAADFNVEKVMGPPSADFSGYRLVLDEEADYELLKIIYERLGDKGPFGLNDVLALLAAEPALAEINRDVRQKDRPPTPGVG